MIRFITGLLMMFGAVGRHDFYDECLMAADCVAGDAPSLTVTVIIGILAALIMLWPILDGSLEKYKG